MSAEVYPMRDRGGIGITEEPERKPSASNMNVNRYATKKTIAQGMLDIALLTANASQLKYVLQVGKERHPFYTFMITLISISIVLQITVGICFLFIGSLNINKPLHQRKADIINNLITIQIFVITVINVVISSFGIEYVVIEEDKYNRRGNSGGFVRREVKESQRVPETEWIWETGQAIPFFQNATIDLGRRISFNETHI